jgi:hypothetical protein
MYRGHEFSENWFSDGHTLRKDVNEFPSLSFLFFFDRWTLFCTKYLHLMPSGNFEFHGAVRGIHFEGRKQKPFHIFHISIQFEKD